MNEETARERRERSSMGIKSNTVFLEKHTSIRERKGKKGKRKQLEKGEKEAVCILWINR